LESATTTVFSSSVRIFWDGGNVSWGGDMFLQIDMIDSQVIYRPDGSVEIHGQRGYMLVEAKYANEVKEAYQELRKASATDSLKIAVNIEVPQPVGAQVNED
jgi:hypothetical protein